MADRCHIGKYIYGYKSVNDCVICAKFCMKMQNLIIMTFEHQKFEFWKLKKADGFAWKRYGRRCYSPLLQVASTCHLDPSGDTLVYQLEAT